VAKTLVDEQGWPATTRSAGATAGVRTGGATRRLEFDFGGQHTKAELDTLHDGALVLAVNGQAAPLSFTAAGDTLEVRYAVPAHARGGLHPGRVRPRVHIRRRDADRVHRPARACRRQRRRKRPG
jgi:hypothetical protein